MAATINYETDWNGRLLGRLYWQFRDKPKIRAWVSMVARQFQDLEDACQALLTIVSIDDSVGAQLDNLGRVLGQPRLGNDDLTYRLYLKTRIVANRSDGTPEAIYKVFRALYGSAVSMVLTTSLVGVKTFRLTVNTALSQVQTIAGLSFLRVAKEAGARAILEFQAPDNVTLRFDVASPGFDVGIFGGATQA